MKGNITKELCVGVAVYEPLTDPLDAHLILIDTWQKSEWRS